jgi:hypothetical protein
VPHAVFAVSSAQYLLSRPVEGNVADKQTQDLAQEARGEIEDDLTTAEASKKIDELQKPTGRGTA